MSARSKKARKRSSISQRTWQIVVFAMLATLMFCSKIVMEALPNIHLLGVFTMAYTVVFRKKALIPIYGYVMLNGLYAGFNMWWVPYLYIWTILWAVTMLLPKNMSNKAKCIVYPIVCCLHGLAFGALYAPAQAIMLGMSFEQAIAWIMAGVPWDILHCVGNLVVGMLVFPLSELLRKLVKTSRFGMSKANAALPNFETDKNEPCGVKKADDLFDSENT